MPTSRLRVMAEISFATCLLALVRAPVISHANADETPSVTEVGKLRETILALDDHFWAAACRYDVKTLNRLFAADYYGLGNDGSRWTKATMLEQHRTARLGDLKLTSEREVIALGEHTVLLTYDARFKVFTKDGVLRDTAHQRLLSCRVQRDGEWVVVFSQATDLAVPTTQTEAIDSQADNPSRCPERPKEGNEHGTRGISKPIVINLRDVLVDEVDVGQNTISVTIGRKDDSGRKPEGESDQGGKDIAAKRISTRLVNLPVAKDAEIRISFRHEPSVATNEQRGLSELTRGMPASLELSVSEDDIVKPLAVSKVVGWRDP
jgi:hypothetical protein